MEENIVFQKLGRNSGLALSGKFYYGYRGDLCELYQPTRRTFDLIPSTLNLNPWLMYIIFRFTFNLRFPFIFILSLKLSNMYFDEWGGYRVQGRPWANQMTN